MSNVEDPVDPIEQIEPNPESADTPEVAREMVLPAAPPELTPEQHVAAMKIAFVAYVEAVLPGSAKDLIGKFERYERRGLNIVKILANISVDMRKLPESSPIRAAVEKFIADYRREYADLFPIIAEVVPSSRTSAVAVAVASNVQAASQPAEVAAGSRVDSSELQKRGTFEDLLLASFPGLAAYDERRREHVIKITKLAFTRHSEESARENPLGILIKFLKQYPDLFSDTSSEVYLDSIARQLSFLAQAAYEKGVAVRAAGHRRGPAATLPGGQIDGHALSREADRIIAMRTTATPQPAQGGTPRKDRETIPYVNPAEEQPTDAAVVDEDGTVVEVRERPAQALANVPPAELLAASRREAPESPEGGLLSRTAKKAAAGFGTFFGRGSAKDPEEDKEE